MKPGRLFCHRCSLAPTQLAPGSGFTLTKQNAHPATAQAHWAGMSKTMPCCCHRQVGKAEIPLPTTLTAKCSPFLSQTLPSSPFAPFPSVRSKAVVSKHRLWKHRQLLQGCSSINCLKKLLTAPV